LACAMDRLLETVLSTPGIMDEYGNPAIREFFVAKETETEAALKVAGLALTLPADSDRTVGRKIQLPCYGITVTLARENGWKSRVAAPSSVTSANTRRPRIDSTTRLSTALNR